MEIDVYRDWLKINEPEPAEGYTHYTLLRLKKFEDDSEKIRDHYKKLNTHVRMYASGPYSVQSQELMNKLAKCMLCLTDAERRRAYDESIGRVFEEEEGVRPTVDRILIKQGHIDRPQAKETADFCDQSGLTFCDAVVQKGFVDRETAAKAYADELGFAYFDLEAKDARIHLAVVEKFPKQLCRTNTALPFRLDDGVLLVACADELTHKLEDAMRLCYGNVKIHRVMATLQSIVAAIDLYYGTAKEIRETAAEADSTEEVATTKKESAKKKAPAGPVKRFSQLTAEEQHHKKQVGYIVMLWGVMIPVLIDQYVFKPAFPALAFGFLPSLTTLLISPAVVFYVLKVYWK